MMRGQRGQTAAEYLGVLLVVSVIIAGIAGSSLGQRIRDGIEATVCRIAAADDCEAPAGSRRDRDGDGISNRAERRAGLDPDSADTDKDGIPDRRELEAGTSPLSADSDFDGVSDREEAASGGKLDPTKPDTDGDGLTDGEEATIGTDPSEADSDGYATPGDGLSDAEEIARGSDPNTYDSDGDGYGDGHEVRHGDDPTSDERSIFEKGFDTFVLDDPLSVLLPTGAAAKYLTKGLVLKARSAYKALREAKTLAQASKARRDLLAVFRERLRRTPKPDAAEEAVRRELMERLARNLNRRRLAHDPDKGGITPGSLIEADDAIKLQSLGIARGPLRRADPASNPAENGADFVDGSNRLWDHKRAISRDDRPFDPAGFLDNVEANDIRNGERIMLNDAQLKAADREALEREIDRRGLRSEIVFIPRDP